MRSCSENNSEVASSVLKLEPISSAEKNMAMVGSWLELANDGHVIRKAKKASDSGKN